MSCEFELNTSTFQNFVNTTLLEQLRETPIPPNPNFSGTFNSFDVDGIEFQGSGGNSTCAGYDYNYKVFLNSMSNVLQFEIIFPSSSFCLTDISPKNLPSTIATSYQYKYIDQLVAKVNCSSNSAAYIPIDNCPLCCSDPFESCFYKTCCNGCINQQSTLIYIPVDYVGDIATTPNQAAIDTSVTVGSTLPSGYTVVTSTDVIMPVGFFSRVSTLYLYDLKVTNMDVNVSNVEFTSSPFSPPGGLNLSYFNNNFTELVNKYLVPLANQAIANNAFQFNLIYSS
jgi:hypothetical protein